MYQRRGKFEVYARDCSLIVFGLWKNRQQSRFYFNSSSHRERKRRSGLFGEIEIAMHWPSWQGTKQNSNPELPAPNLVDSAP